jgi:hypothetical protein
MEALAFVIAVIAAFAAGYEYNRLKRSLVQFREGLKAKADVRKPLPNSSAFIDPLDLATKTRFEHEEALKRINPGDS